MGVGGGGDQDGVDILAAMISSTEATLAPTAAASASAASGMASAT